MNGDTVSLLIERGLFDPWTTRILDWFFYTGVAITVTKLIKGVCSIIPGVYTYLFPKIRQLSLKEKYGRWAVITGATSEMGVAFAKELARCGFDVVLISRSYDNLIDVVSEIQTEYTVQAYGIHADFFLGQQVFNEIEQALLTDILDVGILVNVNPIKYDHPQYFSQVPVNRLWQLVNVNLAATTMMSHLVLPTMLEKGRGAIINVSSALGNAPPTPLLAAEAASMSFVTTLGRALHEECRHKGIIVQTLTPLSFVKGQNSLISPSPQVYVRHALQTLCYDSHCSGYWPHAVINFLYQLVPSKLWVWFVGTRNRTLRHKHLTTGITTDTGLFARRLRRASAAVVTDVMRRSSSPRRTSSFHDNRHRPSFQRHYSRVAVMPSSLPKESLSESQ